MCKPGLWMCESLRYALYTQDAYVIPVGSMRAKGPGWVANGGKAQMQPQTDAWCSSAPLWQAARNRNECKGLMAVCHPACRLELHCSR